MRHPLRCAVLAEIFNLMGFFPAVGIHASMISGSIALKKPRKTLLTTAANGDISNYVARAARMSRWILNALTAKNGVASKVLKKSPPTIADPIIRRTVA